MSGVWCLVVFGESGYEFGDLIVQFGQSLLCRWAVGTDFLSCVIQVRQIDVEKLRLGLPRGDDCRVDDPGCAVDIGQRAPKVFQRKIAQGVAQLAVHFSRTGIAPERFAAVGVVNGGRRANEIGIGAFAVQREPNGGAKLAAMMAEDIPDLRLLDAIVPGGPHFYLLFVAPIKSVRHDTVLIGKLAGRHVRLHRTSDAGKTWRQNRLFAVAG